MKIEEGIASCVECPRCDGGRLRLLEGICKLCQALGGIIGLAVMLSGCALFSKPSKARYKVLLGECREHEREYVRMNQANAKRADGCRWIKFGQQDFLTAKELKQGGSWICPESVSEPQRFGSVGFGEGGHE